MSRTKGTEQLLRTIRDAQGETYFALRDGILAGVEELERENNELREDAAIMRETLQRIANADWRKWEELASPDEFVAWAKRRAAHALAVGHNINSNSDGFELAVNSTDDDLVKAIAKLDALDKGEAG